MSFKPWQMAGALLLASTPALALNSGTPAYTSGSGNKARTESAGLTRPTVAMVHANLDELATNDEALNAFVSRQFGADLSPEKRQFAVAQQRRVFASPGLKRFTTRVMTEKVAQGATDEELFEIAGAAAITRTGKGLARLPVSKQRAFTTYMLQMYQGLSGEHCNQLASRQTTLADLQQVEDRWIVRLPQARFEQVVSLYTEATLAQLDAPESTAQVRPSQVKQAEQATMRFKETLRLQAQRQFSPAALARVTSAHGQARETCEFGVLMMQTLLQMPEADFMPAFAALFDRM